MYCPVCFNDTLRIKSRGVVEVIINGKQMDAGRFLFNLEGGRTKELADDLSKKLEEFFRWYVNFQNKDDIKYVELNSADFACSDKCNIPLNVKFSVVDILIPPHLLKDQLEKLGKKYNMQIKLKI